MKGLFSEEAQAEMNILKDAIKLRDTKIDRLINDIQEANEESKKLHETIEYMQRPVQGCCAEMPQIDYKTSYEQQLEVIDDIKEENYQYRDTIKMLAMLL